MFKAYWRVKSLMHTELEPAMRAKSAIARMAGSNNNKIER